ncbi:multiheme c-type cytochrome [Paracoccus sp. MBLB3053]|uniref:Multiheme c-type cytochrome n=1 Tax=Paracoccus aurantius TaxID=3073814 RepID=A0ABU2HXC8_9RHOB|nr:multiheme c-type cytochrome [Paracoccus sp. MBLB3053]MDS9469397.1 multiheme c-type cytochrome [Paracoccus sp. MBLB3053]
MIARLSALLLALTFGPAIAQETPAYVGSAQCASCHAAEAETWKGSHHGLAWTEPSQDTIVADFDNSSFEGNGMTVKFSHDDKGYHARVTERDGVTTDYTVHSVIGIAPLQQYIFETEPGRLQSFDVVWDDDLKKWYHLYPDQELPPSDGLHWTGSYKNWNARCAECHATGFEKNYDPETRNYHSIQAEIGVGCEACHGPGSKHLEWVENRIPVSIAGLDAHGFTMPTDGGAEKWIQQCAGCHSRREAFGEGNPLPGTPYHDAYRLSLLTPGLYHSDGQILQEVYEYGSFLQSKMYAKGVSCMNCHDPHSAQLVADGNAVCLQCHSPAGNPDFPTLPLKEFDSPAHHFHKEGSEGALCRNCHMVEQTYMGIDERADHSFRIPRPDLAAETGAPDACTTCHKDQTAEWAATKIEEWYPDSEKRGPHFGTTIARMQTEPAGAVPSLAALARDKNSPDIVRATALYLLEAAADPKLAGSTSALLRDPSPIVRSSAARLQRAAAPEDSVKYLSPLLTDPVRLVRFAAAQEFLSLPTAGLSQSVGSNLKRAMDEWRGSLGNRLDFPETHLVLGGLALTMRNLTAATGAFREVVRLDPQRVEAWVMLVRIAAAQNGPDAARRVVDEALAINPEDPALRDLRSQL